MSAEQEVRRILKEQAIPERHNRHEAFRLNGWLIVVTNTRTDPRAWFNKLSEVRRALRTPYIQTRCNGR
jgi:hypothetical protein